MVRVCVPAEGVVNVTVEVSATKLAPVLIHDPPTQTLQLLPLQLLADVSSVPAVKVMVEITVIESWSVQYPPEPLNLTLL